MPDEVISDEEVRKALNRSGYLLEYRLETLLREREYWVRANAAVPDPYTHKWRELDLRTVKKVTRHAADLGCFVFAEILVECANNPEPIAFMTRKAEDSILYREDVKLSGYPLHVLNGSVREYWSPLYSYLSFQNFHHHCNGWVASQWCSFQKKKDGKSKPKDEGQWMAFHREQDHEVFHKLCFAVDHFMNEHFSRLTFEEEEPVDIAVFYPVMVVQGKLLDVSLRNDSLEIRKTDHVQYRMGWGSVDKEAVYQIDIVTESAFSRYLDIVEHELNEIADRLQQERGLVRKSLDVIVNRAKVFQSLADRRVSLESIPDDTRVMKI